MNTTSGIGPFEPLLGELFDAFESAGRPAMPAARRPAVVALLTRVMADPQLFFAYTDRLADERRRRGIEIRLLSVKDEDIPAEQIFTEGFTAVADDILADIALSPEALQALADCLYDPEADIRLGSWFLDPVPSRSSPPPGQVAPRAVDRPTPSPRAGRSRWLAIAAASAASFVVGILVGPRLFDTNRRSEISLAQVSVRGDPARGIEDVQIDVANAGSARGFVTIVGLGPGDRRPVVHNRSGETFLVVPPGETAAVKNLPPEFEGVTAVVVVLSNVPAGEAVRVALPPTAGADGASDIAEKLRAALTANNVRAETKVVPIPNDKR
jgi:hypothetical protein